MTAPSQSPVITTGIKGPCVARLELREFLKNKDLTNLFLLAMDRMMKIPQEKVDSWFQVGGIHGRPYIPYDNVGTKGTHHGYCCHSSTLFPPWHRPYLALYEQQLGKNAKEIAYQYQNAADRDRYTSCADSFRVPYWDWAIEAPLPDIVATQKKVTVYHTDGKEHEIDNPLYGYKFNPAYDDFSDDLPGEKKWKAWKTTVRYPTTDDEKAESQPAKMQETLKNNQYTLRDRVYNLLTCVTNYDKFSHDATGGIDIAADGLDSIESIHNQMHVLGGDTGHMGEVDYAAFDPIFWLHHANVDRLFAIWQELNPKKYVTSLPSQAGTFTRFPGETEDIGSLLTPFRKPAANSDTFWTSKEVRDTRIYNYTYPDLEGLDKFPYEERLKHIRVRVNTLYGKTAPVSAVKPSAFKPLHVARTTVPSTVAPAPSKGVPAPSKDVHAPSTVAHEYVPSAATHHEHAPSTVAHEYVPSAATHHEHAPSTVAHEYVPSVATHHEHAPSVAHAPYTAAHNPSTAAHNPSTVAHIPSTIAHAISSTATPKWHGKSDEDKPHYHEWFANIQVEKYAVKKSFLVHIFFGDVPSDHHQWRTHANLVGSHSIFANRIETTGCVKCQSAKEVGLVVGGTIPLTHALGNHFGQVSSLEPKDVLPILKQKLKVRVQTVDGEVVELSKTPSLKCNVGSSLVETPESHEHFPVVKKVEVHYDATRV